MRGCRQRLRLAHHRLVRVYQSVRLGRAVPECVLHRQAQRRVCIADAVVQGALLQHGCVHVEGHCMVDVLELVRSWQADSQRHLRHKLHGRQAHRVSRLSRSLRLRVECD